MNYINDLNPTETKTYKEYHGVETPYIRVPKIYISDEEADFYIRQYWIQGKTTTQLEGKFSQSTIERVVFGKLKSNLE